MYAQVEQRTAGAAVRCKREHETLSPGMTDEERALLGQWVRWHRKAKGWGQRELARRVGKAPASIQNLEYGKVGRGREPLSLQPVEQALELPPGYLEAAARSGKAPTDQQTELPAYEEIRERQAANGTLDESIFAEIDQVMFNDNLSDRQKSNLVRMLLTDRERARRSISKLTSD